MLLLGKTEESLNHLYDEIEEAGYPQPAVIPFNLKPPLAHQYDELAAMIENEFRPPDGLLHNAAILGPRTPLEQLSGDNFMRVMQINVNAAFMQATRRHPMKTLHFAPRMALLATLLTHWWSAAARRRNWWRRR